MHNAGTKRITKAFGAQLLHLGVERQQSGHQRAVSMSGTRMDHLTGRLINDGEVFIVQDHVHQHRGIGLDGSVVRHRQYGYQMLALLQRRRGLHHTFVVACAPATGQDGVLLRPRESGEHRKNAVDADVTERGWHQEIEGLAVKGINYRIITHRTNSLSPRSTQTNNTTKPAVIATSARSKTGKLPSAMKSVT